MEAGTGISFAYDAEGLRLSKTVTEGGTAIEYKYYYRGSSLTDMIWGTNRFHIFYDGNGSPVSFTYGGSTYYYVKNLQGDITAITDADGSIITQYSYDAWGNPVSVTGSQASTIGAVNPLRYRGYVWDDETELYYAYSRYYNFEVCRFINADAAIGKIGNIQGSNVFAYCFNSPVNMFDPTGNWPKLSTIFTMAAVTAIVVAAVAVTVASCGAAVPAFAVVGGNIIGEMSAGAATTAASVAIEAMIVAGVSTVASITSTVAEKSYSKKTKQNNTEYKLVDNNGRTQYIGRTTNVTARAKAHKKNPFRKDLTMEIIASNIDYSEARGLELIAMLECHTINTANRMNNQINGISPFNRSLGIYMEAGRGVAEYLGNQVSNEILYWTGN